MRNDLIGENIEEKANDEDSLLSPLRQYSAAPLKFLSEYKTMYEEQKQRLVGICDSSFETVLSVLISKFRPFLALDWIGVINDLLKRGNPYVLSAMAAFKSNDILPSKLEDNLFFKNYRSIVERDEYIKVFFAHLPSEEIGRLHVFGADTRGAYQVIEQSGRDFYIVSMQCASYARAVGDSTRFCCIDVRNDVVVLNGIEYSSGLSLDKIVYWEL